MSSNPSSFPPAAAKETFNPADNFRGESRPEHHLHRDSEPLPGGDSTAYGQGRLRDPSVWENRRDVGTSSSCRAFPAPFNTMPVLISDIRLLFRRYWDSPRDA